MNYWVYSIKAHSIQKTFPCGQNLIAFWITIMYLPLPTGPFQTWHSLERKNDIQLSCLNLFFASKYQYFTQEGCIRKKISYKCTNSDDKC